MADADIRERTVSLVHTPAIPDGWSIRAELQEQGMNRVFIQKAEKKHALSDFEKTGRFDQTDNCVRTISWKIA